MDGRTDLVDDIKKEIMEYWTGRVEKFEALRLDEWNSNKHQRWLNELNRLLPTGKKLDILDCGTGTGFFSFLLTAEGHSVTGIDLTEEMICGAKRTANRLELYPCFQVMDAEDPVFEQESFDAIVTRNLTSFLPNLSRTYRNWFGLLRKGGILINFDGDYHHDLSDVPLPAEHAHKDLTKEQNIAYAHISNELKEIQQKRPMWDIQLLRQAGFEDIRVDLDCYWRIYREIDRFYNPTPIFCLTARK